MGKGARYMFLGMLAAELIVVFALLWKFGLDTNILIVVALAPSVLGVAVVCGMPGAIRTKAQSVWHPNMLMMISAVFGLSGMLAALGGGAHLAGSVAVYVAIVQGGLLWLGIWRSRKSPQTS